MHQIDNAKRIHLSGWRVRRQSVGSVGKLCVSILVCCIQLMTIATALGSQQITFADVSIALSDTFERLTYDGYPVGYQSSDKGGSSSSNAVLFENIEQSYVVYSGKGSHASVQLQVVASSRKKTITQMKVSSFSNVETGSLLPDPTLYLIDNIRELGSADGSATVYPDALTPLTEVEGTVNYDGGIRFLFDFPIPTSSSAGNHKGNVSIEFADGTGIVIPIEVVVWNFELPASQSVAMQLFSLDTRSIAYWYGLDPSDPELLEILSDGAKLLVDHRFALSSVIPFPIEDESRRPELSESSDYFIFDRGDTLEKHVATFDQLANSFSVKMRVAFDQRSSGVFLKHQWHNRESGYRLSYENGGVTFDTWTRGEFDTNTTLPELLSLTQVVDVSKDVHDLELSVSNGLWALTVDGNEVTENRQQAIIPAVGGWVSIGSGKARLRLYNIDWTFAESAGDNAAPTFESWISKSISDGKASRSGSDLAEQEWLREWAKFSIESTGSVNDLKSSPREKIETVMTTYASIEDLLDGRTPYVSLPHDEVYKGKGSENNIRFAQQLNDKIPELDIFHTFGAMRGAGTSRAMRGEVLERFSKYVNIYSLRPSVYFENKEFFDKYKDESVSVSMYIHDVNIIERDDVLLLGRGFFWNLFELDVSKVSFWNTSLWFQPEKPGRPARVLKKVDDGFAVTKRNPSGIGAGMIFYPGKNGLLPSLRSIAWRDGLEDFEMLRMVGSIAKYSGTSEPRISHAKDAVALKKQLGAPIHAARDFRKLPGDWGTRLRESRHALGALLHSVSSEK